jgi:hypothetical protein
MLAEGRFPVLAVGCGVGDEDAVAATGKIRLVPSSESAETARITPSRPRDRRQKADRAGTAPSMARRPKNRRAAGGALHERDMTGLFSLKSPGRQHQAERRQ